MGITRYVLLPTAFAATLLITACGGGGGGGGTTASTVTLTPAGALNFVPTDDVFVSVSGVLGGTEGTGLWDQSGGGSDSGSADGAGGAGDGEFVKVSVNLPRSGGTGTLNWNIIRSAYGQTGKTGQMNIVADSGAGSVGGYKVTTGAGVNQSNIFVSKSGQISGSLPLPVGTGGSISDSVFVAARIKDLPSPSLATYAGTYNYVAFSAEKGTGKNPNLETGVVYLAANGQGRICPVVSPAIVATYSSSCTNGADVVASFDKGTGSGSILRIAQDPASKTNINNFQIDMIGVAKPFTSTANTSGMAFIGDFVYYNTTDGTRTGALYASRQDGSTLQPTDVLGTGQTPSYWNVTGKNVSSTGVTTPFTKYVALIQSTVGGVTGVRRVIYDPTQTPACSNTGAAPFVAGSAQGAPGTLLAKITNPDTSFYYLGVAMSDADSFVFRGDTAFGIGRRTNSALVQSYFASCQPQ